MNHVLKIVDSTRKTVMISNKVLTVPANLPMITKPKPYALKSSGDITYGGYLNNDILFTMGLFIDKIGYRDSTKLMPQNSIINLINGVSSVPYKINKETLRYISLNGIEKGIILDPDEDDIKEFNLNPYKKMSKKLNSDLRSKLSVIQLQNYILNIAEVYKSVPHIYFPVRLDQRTRLYCVTDFFNYQSSDLAKSLLCFANYGTIYKYDVEGIKYFKAYGAMLFDGDLAKKSINHRVQ